MACCTERRWHGAAAQHSAGKRGQIYRSRDLISVEITLHDSQSVDAVSSGLTPAVSSPAAALRATAAVRKSGLR